MRVQNYAIFISLLLLGCRSNLDIQPIIRENVRVENTSPDEKMEAIISPYRRQMEASMNEELVYSLSVLDKGLPESALGNVVSDAVLNRSLQWVKQSGSAEVPEMVLLNNGGLRTSLPSGTIRVSDVFELMPFENEIVILTLTPEKMQELLSYIADKGGAPVSGIRLNINIGKAENISINGSPYHFDRNVTLVTSDYLYSGGDGMTFFQNPIYFTETRIKVRDAIIDYFKSIHTEGLRLDIKTDGRISK